MSCCTLLRTLVLIGLCLLAGDHARAGGMRIVEESLQIDGGPNRTFQPGAPVSVSFSVEGYEYGSNEFKYVYFAIVPVAERAMKPTAAQLAKWKLL